MVKVRLTFPDNWPIFRQTPGQTGEWNNYKFFLDTEIEKEFDFWVVYENLTEPIEKTILPKPNTIFITGEPPEIKTYSARFVNQFNTVITSHEKMPHTNKLLIPQCQHWFVNKSYDELVKIKPIEKTKKISMITSTKTFTEGHRKRLDFALKLKAHFGDAVDLFGRGIKDFDDKWDTLEAYRYNICMENSAPRYYFTEKIIDCYLAYSFPVYYGCTNLENYFDEEAFKRIDINDFAGSVKVIEQLLEDDDHYERRLQALIEARDKCLHYYNIFPMLTRIMDSALRESVGPKTAVYLRKDIKPLIKGYAKKIIKRI
ncbi:glycosyltransferase family 10 domain-containing protein [Chitinophaga sp. HK235]|uniref:glycosyltransferase family 10 domain-containing protein n=1 Tax=Chitinophaga sp. HK235 TaxID=2952571 RepID=UPI001BAA5EB1|nr:glycosyltransferase family 10 [Chitinophaga sp. HK235]